MGINPGIFVLDTASKIVRARLASAAATTQPTFSTSYRTVFGGNETPGSEDGAFNDTTNVTLAAAPAAGVQKYVDQIKILNQSTTSETFRVEVYDGTTARPLFEVTVGTLYSIELTPAGLIVKDANGADALPSPLPVAYGGTGLTSITAGAFMTGNGTGSVALVGPGTTGQIPVSNGSAPVMVSMSGDVTLVSSGAATVANCELSALDITGGTAQALLASDDKIPFYDTSATANRTITPLNMGGFFNPLSVCDFRLSLESGVAVSTTDQSAKGTLYAVPMGDTSAFAAPAGSARIALYNGTNWAIYLTSEFNLTLTLTSGSVYDVFVYDNSGTVTLETLVWTNTTTRATELVLQDGVLMKNGALTRRYLGTIYASGTNQTSDALRARFVWNFYHRRKFSDYSSDTTDSWSVDTEGSWVAINSSNAAWKHESVNGVSEEPLSAWIALHTTRAGADISGAVALDSTSAIDRTRGAIACNNIQTNNGTYGAFFRAVPGIGYHYLQGLEFTSAGAAGTTYGDNADGTIKIQSGMLVEGWR